MDFLYCALMGYLMGCVNPSWLLARWKGFDIRTRGSGNAGASNALILLGRAAFALCAVVDIAKAYFATAWAKQLFPEFSSAFAVAATFCVLGHIFPFYMKFRGGKGLASLGGVVLSYDWRLFLLMLLAEAIIGFSIGYLCFVPITASAAFPILYGALSGDLLGALFLGVLFFVILFKHGENLSRIRNGTEMRLKYLWKPQAEIERVRKNSSVSKEIAEDRLSCEREKN